MSFTEKEIEKIVDHLMLNKVNCPCCGGSDLDLQNDLFVSHAVTLASGKMDYSGLAYLSIIATCKDCYHTMFFKAAPILGWKE